MNVYPEPVLGEVAPGTNGETVIAWGHVDADVDGVDFDRWCILTLLPPTLRVPNEVNYAVMFFYPGELPRAANGDGVSPRIEMRETFPNIVPAVECYRDMGMDW